jgi:Ca2+/Na+ antiporter
MVYWIVSGYPCHLTFWYALFLLLLLLLLYLLFYGNSSDKTGIRDELWNLIKHLKSLDSSMCGYVGGLMTLLGPFAKSSLPRTEAAHATSLIRNVLGTK